MQIDDWSVVRCRRCGLLRTWPLPPAQVLRRLYDEPEYFETRTVGDQDAWAGRARQIIAMLPEPPSTVLDFGAGEGHLVRALRDAGIPAQGVEPSAPAQEAALRDQGVGLLESLDDVPGPFSTITLLHSLEHVEDPLATLVALRSVMTAGGSMFIEVPHARSADMWIPSSRRAILDLPAHLHHFTPETLGALAERAELSVAAVRLFNPRPVETALRRREMRQATRVAQHAAGSVDRPCPRRPAANLAERALAALRAALPGSTFRLVARRR